MYYVQAIVCDDMFYFGIGSVDEVCLYSDSDMSPSFDSDGGLMYETRDSDES